MNILEHQVKRRFNNKRPRLYPQLNSRNCLGPNQSAIITITILFLCSRNKKTNEKKSWQYFSGFLVDFQHLNHLPFAIIINRVKIVDIIQGYGLAFLTCMLTSYCSCAKHVGFLKIFLTVLQFSRYTDFNVHVFSVPCRQVV